ncbi:MAG: sulfite exporter TauE/SafE family protein [Burkholderiaceae bacterium]
MSWTQEILSLAGLAGAGLVVMFGYTVVGLTGFGASMVAVPILVLMMPLHVALPMMLVFDLVSGLLFGVRLRRRADGRELLRLLPFMLVGVVLGVTVLVKAPERVLLLLLGGSVLVFAGWSLLRPGTAGSIRPMWAVPAGTVGGIFSALFGTGGPVYTMYLARRLGDKATLRATISLLLFLSALARLASFLFAGLFTRPGLLPLILLMLPCALLGMYLGARLHHRLPGQRITQLVWLVLIAGASSLILRHW